MDGNKDKSIGGTATPKDAARGFGALKAVLSVVSINYKVRSLISTQNPSSTNPSAGKYLRRRKHDRKSPLSYN